MKITSLAGIGNYSPATRITNTDKVSDHPPADEAIAWLQQSGYSWTGKSLNLSEVDNAASLGASSPALNGIDLEGPDPDNQGEAYGEAKRAMAYLVLYQDLLLSSKIGEDLQLPQNESFSLLNALDEYRTGQVLPMANSDQPHPDSKRITSWLDTHSDQVLAVTELFDVFNSGFSSLEDFQQHYNLEEGEAGAQKAQQITEQLTAQLDRAKLEWRAKLAQS